MRANPYVIRANLAETNGLLFNTAGSWQELEEDMQEKILGLCGSQVFAYRSHERRLPEELRPPELLSLVSCNQILEIERSRANIEGHGPEDKLTVTFSDVVTRGNGFYGLDCDAARAEEQGWPFDEDAIYAAMDYKQTWTDVSKIRLVRGRAHLDDQCTKCYVELVRQGEDGEETVRIPHDFYLSNLAHTTPMHFFARRLSEELHLRHTVVQEVDGNVDEYAV
jgi:hypothetical protein